MAGFITFLVVIVAIALIGLVLVQRTKSGGGLGAVSGGQSEAMFGANAGNVLGKTTAWLIAIFFGLTLMLTLVKPTADGPKSKMTAADNEVTMAAPVEEVEVPAEAPATPVAPAETPAPAREAATGN